MTEEEYSRTILRAKRGVILIGSIFAALLLLITVLCGISKYQRTFSKEKWALKPNARYKMVDDMLEKYELIGMDEADVIQLLGQEDNNEITSFKQNRQYYPTDSTLVYWLGVSSMNDNWLILSTDHGIITDYCLGET